MPALRKHSGTPANTTRTKRFIIDSLLWRGLRDSMIRLPFGLLALVQSYRLLDLAFDGLEVEGGRCLHRRILDGSLRQLHHVLLDHHKTPELTGVELVHVT